MSAKAHVVMAVGSYAFCQLDPPHRPLFSSTSAVAHVRRRARNSIYPQGHRIASLPRLLHSTTFTMASTTSETTAAPPSSSSSPSSSVPIPRTHSHAHSQHNAAHPPHAHAANDHDHAHAPAHPSPAMDASKLNHTPAPLPLSEGEPGSPPLRDASTMFSNPFGGGETAYLDNEPQHPTVAETGVLSTSPRQGPGPRMGQLKRRESEPMPQRRIIRLASFGGEGLAAKPARPCPGEVEEEAIV